MLKLKNKIQGLLSNTGFLLFLFFVFLVFVFFFLTPKLTSISYNASSPLIQKVLGTESEKETKLLPIDKASYDAKLVELANNPPQPKDTIKKVKQVDGTYIDEVVKAVPRIDRWPVKNLPYPNAGAILPFNRIVAYYGNLYSRKMGVLGQYDEAEMISRLSAEVKKWELADPSTPVVPALHYIAVVAQGSAGADGKYRARMPDSEIDKVLKIAEKIPNAVVFLDIQVGLSDLQSEVPKFEKYLKMPNVHLGIDAEFAMQKSGKNPGKVVGTLDASEVNFVIDYLSKIVRENKEVDLPPKILVVHRYTEKMITNYKNIKPTAEVQVVMHMDGWGGQAHKISTYDSFVRKQPVQFTGFKLFYKNDIWEKGTVMFEPSQLLKLSPRPSYIQYQ